MAGPHHRFIVGMSGGVDSSVAALLLLEQGWEVEALFMKNWLETGEDGSCLWERDVEDAMSVCERLGIPLNTVDLSRDYWERVFQRFLAEYRTGRTPNPDVLCNQEVKFKAFLDHALHYGADAIATGHYARLDEQRDGPELRKGVDRNKDQSYFLCRLTRHQMARSVFPLGALHKSEVRARAARAGLRTHDKRDSTGICFIGERPFREFLAGFLPVERGEIRTLDGRVVGEHDGMHFYTIGQRQGLGVGGVAGRGERPWYVAGKDPAGNVLTVVQGADHPLLLASELIAEDVHWMVNPPAGAIRCMAKTRYRQPDQPCSVTCLETSSIRVSFDGPQRALAPGQYVVLYDGDLCLGSAVINTVRHAAAGN